MKLTRFSTAISKLEFLPSQLLRGIKATPRIQPTVRLRATCAPSYELRLGCWSRSRSVTARRSFSPSVLAPPCVSPRENGRNIDWLVTSTAQVASARFGIEQLCLVTPEPREAHRGTEGSDDFVCCYLRPGARFNTRSYFVRQPDLQRCTVSRNRGDHQAASLAQGVQAYSKTRGPPVSDHERRYVPLRDPICPRDR
jgi:hypothetical protein